MPIRLKKDFDPIVIDNFLDEEDQEFVLEVLTTEAPWHFKPQSVSPDLCNDLFPADRHVFTSFFVRNRQPLNQHAKMVDYIIFKFLEGTKYVVNFVERAQANFDTPGKTPILRTPHTDISIADDANFPEGSKFITLLYYVNTADGNTVLFDKKTKKSAMLDEMPNTLMEVAPKQGQLLIFDSAQYHCNWTPVESEYRMVININLLLENLDE